MKKLSIDIIIPLYFAPEHTVRCAESVIRTTKNLSQYDIKIILVDDSGSLSFGKTLEYLLKSRGIFDDIEIITRKSNGGFIEACYTGIEYRDSDYKLLLNSDTLVLGSWLTNMVKTAESDERIALVNPNTNHAAVIQTPLPKGTNILMMQKYFENCEFTDSDEIDIVSAVGFCLLIKSKYIKEYGFFDRIYGIGYGEETDLHFRYVKNGMRSVISTKAFVYHRGEASFSDREERYKRNREIFLSRYSKEYFKDYPEFEKKTVLNKIRLDLLNNIEHIYEYIFLVQNNDYLNPDYYFVSKLANQLIEKGISCGVVVNDLTDKGDKIEDNLFKEIDIEEFFKKDFDTKFIVSDRKNIESAIKLSVISRSFHGLMVFNGSKNYIYSFDIRKNKIGDRIQCLPRTVSLENVNSFFKGEDKTYTTVVFDEKSSENSLRDIKEILGCQNVHFIYTGSGSRNDAVSSKVIAESDLLKIVNSTKVLIDLRSDVSINDWHLAFLINGCKLYSSSIDISGLDKKFIPQVYHIDDLKKSFASKFEARLNIMELTKYSIRANIDLITPPSLKTKISTSDLRNLFYRYYKLTRDLEKVSYRLVEKRSECTNLNRNRIRYKAIDIIIDIISKIPHGYEALKLVTKFSRKVKLMLRN